MEGKKEEKKGNVVGAVIGQAVLGAVCLAAGWICKDLYGAAFGKGGAGPRAAAAAEETVAATNVQLRAYNLPEKFVAHAEPMQEVELLPQVDGYIKELLFKEGDLVKAGQVLYLLDDERYQAVVNQRKADLDAAEAEARRAARYYSRMQKADARGITQLERDNAEAGAESAAAAVLQAKANLVVAEYDLKKAKVVAPIDGQIGKTSAHVGDYVSPSRGALAHIVQIDPMRVSFPLTDRQYLAWRAALKEGRPIDRRARIVLPDGSIYSAEGKFAFDDNTMSESTATIVMRMTFPNPDRFLVPNTYVNLLTDSHEPPKYPSVPQTAIFDSAGGNVAVWVVDANRQVRARTVRTLEMFEGWVPVVHGLREGETVITSGVAKLREGAVVRFVEPTSNLENNPAHKSFDELQRGSAK